MARVNAAAIQSALAIGISGFASYLLWSLRHLAAREPVADGGLVLILVHLPLMLVATVLGLVAVSRMKRHRLALMAIVLLPFGVLLALPLSAFA